MGTVQQISMVKTRGAPIINQGRGPLWNYWYNKLNKWNIIQFLTELITPPSTLQHTI